MSLLPPATRVKRWSRLPMRRPTEAHGTGNPRGVEGRRSTASEPQCPHRPCAASSSATTCSPISQVSTGADMSRVTFALAALIAHHRKRWAAVVRSTKSSQDRYWGAGAVPPSGCSRRSGGIAGTTTRVWREASCATGSLNFPPRGRRLALPDVVVAGRLVTGQGSHEATTLSVCPQPRRRLSDPSGRLRERKARTCCCRPITSFRCPTDIQGGRSAAA
jgi:hypothetical protein